MHGIVDGLVFFLITSYSTLGSQRGKNLGDNTTDRDFESLIIELRSQGFVNHGIARRLGLKPQTVKRAFKSPAL